MKKLLLSLSILLTLYSATSGQTYFGSETDVLVYLSQKKFTNENTGLTLKFSEMATTLTTGTQVYYSPEIIVTSTTTAVITYSNVNNPGFSGSLLVKATLDILIDRSDRTKIYNFDGFSNIVDMSKAQPIILPRASSHPEYKISKTNDGLYIITNTKTNTPEFYLANQNLFYNHNENRLGYEQADSLCTNFKIGGKENWRLPTFNELEIIHGLKLQIEPRPSAMSMYWSSTKSELNPGQTVKGIMFGTGEIVEGVRHTSGRVLGIGFENYGFTFAVRDMNPENKSISDEILTLKINDSKQLMIAQKGYNSGKTFYQSFYWANDYLNEINKNKLKNYNDWRLPTIDELRILYDNVSLLDGVDGFDKAQDFWSSTNSYEENIQPHYNSNNSYVPGGLKKYYFIKNFKNGKERNDYLGEGIGANYWKASVLIVREVKSSKNLEKYIGTFKSQHPSLDRIEIRKENDSLILKLVTTASFNEFKSVKIKSDSLYFADNEAIKNMKYFANEGEVRYNYLIIFPADSPNKNSLILRKPYGQLIRANKEN